MYAFTRDFDKAMNGEIPVGKPTVIIDVGASIGSTVRVFEEYWPNARIIAIEPYPENIKYLKMNVNGVEIIEKAASNFTGTLKMSCDSENTGLAKVGDTGIDVEADTLDNMVEWCDFIKIDVEGHEFEVLEGASRLLGLNPVIEIETYDITQFEHMFNVIQSYRHNHWCWNKPKG